MTDHVRSSLYLTQSLLLATVTLAGVPATGAAQRSPVQSGVEIAALRTNAIDPSGDQSVLVVGGKSPGTAALISLLVTGGGQLYNEEITKGIVMLSLGILFTVMAIDGVNEYDCDPDETCYPWLLPVGIGGGVGVKIWSIVDAAAGAKRWNERHGLSSLSLRPTFVLSPSGNGSVHIGLLQGTF